MSVIYLEFCALAVENSPSQCDVTMLCVIIGRYEIGPGGVTIFKRIWNNLFVDIFVISWPDFRWWFDRK